MIRIERLAWSVAVAASLASLPSFAAQSATSASSLSARAQSVVEAKVSTLMQSHVLGQELLAQFDRDLEDGKDALHAPAYAKLLALRAIDEETRDELVSLYSELRATAGAEAEMGRTIFETRFLALTTGDSREAQVGRGALVDLARELVSGADRSASSAEAFDGLVELAAGDSARIEQESRAQAGDPKFVRAGAPTISELVDARAGAMQEWAAANLAAPGDVTPPRYAPSSGSSGNIMGSESAIVPNTWALTFDDGPHASYSRQVLANLAKYGLKATFFELAGAMNAYPAISLEVRDAGMDMASHSWNHPQLPKLGSAGLRHQILDAIAAQSEHWGRPVKFFRNPYGAGSGNGTASRRMEADAGLMHVLWNVDTLDWKDHNPTSVYNRARRQMASHGKGVILFHDIHPQSVAASAMLMKYMVDQKITVVTMTQLLNQMNGLPLDGEVVPTPTPTATSTGLPPFVGPLPAVEPAGPASHPMPPVARPVFAPHPTSAPHPTPTVKPRA